MSQSEKIFELPRNLCSAEPLVCVLRGSLQRELPNGAYYVKLKIKNMSAGEIARVTVLLTETNADGRHYRERVEYTYEGLAVPAGAAFGAGVRIPLPHKGVRSFSISTITVFLSDGTRFTVRGEELAPIPVGEALRQTLDYDAQVAWRLRFGRRAVFYPSCAASLWVCTCGTPNCDEAAACTSCRAKRAALFGIDPAVLSAEGRRYRIDAMIKQNTVESLLNARELLSSATDADTVEEKDRVEEMLAVHYAKRERRKKAFKLSAVFAGLLVVAIVVTLLLLPGIRFDRGREYVEQNRYYEAYVEFAKSPRHEDSVSWKNYVAQIVLTNTIAAVEANDFDLAHSWMDSFWNNGIDIFGDGEGVLAKVALYGNGYSMSTPLALKVGNTSFGAYGTVYYVFVPTLSGQYTFYTTGGYDTVGELYDSDRFLIASNDDGGSGSNFSISRQLTAGEIYYIAVRGYGSGYTSGTIVVKKGY